MERFPKWIVHLLPSRERTLWQRFVGVLLTWGLPIVVWEIIQSGVLHAPSQWPFVLTMEVVGTAIGAIFYALIEHLVYRSFPKSDYQPH